jgi:hypothetical protein
MRWEDKKTDGYQRAPCDRISNQSKREREEKENMKKGK